MQSDSIHVTAFKYKNKIVIKTGWGYLDINFLGYGSGYDWTYDLYCIILQLFSPETWMKARRWSSFIVFFIYVYSCQQTDIWRSKTIRADISRLYYFSTSEIEHFEDISYIFQCHLEIITVPPQWSLYITIGQSYRQRACLQ